jgi:hypothetical protein
LPLLGFVLLFFFLVSFHPLKDCIWSIADQNPFETNYILIFLTVPKRLHQWFSSMLAFSAVDCRFESRSGQSKDCKIGICCFSPKPTALRRKSKDWLARNQDDVSEWNDISLILWLFFVFFTGERKICSITCDFFVLGFWLDLRKVMTQTDY